MLAIIAIVFADFAAPFFELARAVFVGWFPSARRILVSIDPLSDKAVWFAFGIFLFVGGLHWFAQGFYRHRIEPTSSERCIPRRWRFRWTAGLLGVLLFPVLAAMCLVGVVHQVTWLAVSSEPAFRNNWLRSRIATTKMLESSRSAAGLLNAEVWDSTIFQSELIKSNHTTGYRSVEVPAWEQLVPIVLRCTNRSDDLVVIRPVDLAMFADIGFVTIGAKQDLTRHKATNLFEVLHSVGQPHKP